MPLLRQLAVVITVAAATFTGPVATTSAAPAPAPAGAAARWCGDLAAGAATIDVMGHSIMAGHGAPTPAAKWTSILSGMLNGDGLPVSVWTGAAVGGSTVAQYLPGGVWYGHTQFTANNPSLVLMGWELNEWGSNPQVSPATFKTQYLQLIAKIREFTPTSTLAIVLSPWPVNGANPPYSIFAYGDVVNQVAAQTGALLLRPGTFFPLDNRYGFYSADGIHHSPAGQWVMGQTVVAILKGWCGRG